MAGDNPIISTYDAIWSLLEANTDFLAMFPNGTPRQVRYTTDLDYAPDPDMAELAPADYPRCRVVMSKMDPNTENDSSDSYLHVRYSIEICTGQQYQTAAMNATWAIYRAMLKWRSCVRDVVTWNGKPCVGDVDALEIDFTDQNRDRNRGTNQWITVWSIVVPLYFVTADLIAL